MNSKELIDVASNGYPDGGLLLQYFDHPNGEHGDTLAKFVVRELVDTHDDSTSNIEQLQHAIGIIETARNDLNSVASELADRISAIEDQ